MRNVELNVSKEELEKAVHNDFIGNDFEEQLEWAMLMIQSKFKQISLYEYNGVITKNTFDKAYLLSSGSLNENQTFFAPFTDLQATPSIFPNINLKYLNIGDTIVLKKIKELDGLSKRKLLTKRRYAFEISYAFYHKDKESFFGTQEGYEIGDSFFSLNKESRKSSLPSPFSLRPGIKLIENAIDYVPSEVISDVSTAICMAYQVAMSMYYEWSIYIKEYDNIGLVIPIEPSILSDIYKTSMMKFENQKRMIHFVRSHYRRRAANPNEDYSIYVNRYLRGENKFNHKGFSAEIIPPKYDLNRAKTRKKFIDPNT